MPDKARGLQGSEVAQRALCRKGVLGAMAIEAERTLLIELAAITSSTGSSSQLLVHVVYLAQRSRAHVRYDSASS
eukprot:6174020-Pleurochrysis_carterae.AAC.4